MARSNNNAQERITPDSMDKMLKRLIRDGVIAEAHETQEDYVVARTLGDSLSLSISSRIDESVVALLKKF